MALSETEGTKDEGESTGPTKEQIAGQKAHRHWCDEIKFYETQARMWEEKSRKIKQRYKDERKDVQQSVPRYNALWSNIQTLKPALYGRLPKPDIERRYRDADDVGRVTSMVLERAITFFVGEKFNTSMKNAVLDRLLPGRAVIWARYEPHFRDEAVTGPAADEGDEVTEAVEGYEENETGDDTQPETMEVVDHEDVCFDYVNYKDFGHTWGRTWDEVEGVWRRVYMSRAKLVKRFGEEIGNKIPLDYTPKDDKNASIDDVTKKATIYEIWDKEDKKALWLHLDYTEGMLDEKDDPLNLEDFFPCPRPMYATLDNDSLIPVPDYSEYQDQALELDNLTARIGAITKAVKVVGVYDKNAEGVQRILAEGIENQLVPVEQWAIFGERGGLAGVTQLLPMQDIMQTLLGLYQARDQVKKDLYEITGIADILRGANDPASTATAEKIKGQFGTLRLSENQDEVQRFVRDLVKIGTEIIAKHFSLDTLKQISGVKLLMAQEKAMLQPWYQAQTAVTQKMKQDQQGQQQPGIGHNGGPPMAGPSPQPGAPPAQQPAPGAMPPPAGGPPPTPQAAAPPAPNPAALLPPQFQNIDPEELMEMMDEASWDDVYALLRSEPLLAYKIDIETDSTIKFDQDSEREDRVAFLGAVGGFINSATSVTNPDLAPLMAKLLMFGVRGFRIGKELEAAFDVAIRKLEKDADNPSRQPSPEIMKIQADMQLQQETAQREDKRIMLQAQTDDAQAKQQQAFDKMKAEMENQLEMFKAKLDSETRIIVAQIAAKTQLKAQAIGAGVDPAEHQDMSMARVDVGDGSTGPTIQDLIGTVVGQLQQTLQGLQSSHAQLAAAITKPRQVMRDPQGNITGIG